VSGPRKPLLVEPVLRVYLDGVRDFPDFTLERTPAGFFLSEGSGGDEDHVTLIGQTVEDVVALSDALAAWAKALERDGA
jgi:hypothetical protein